jgi:hypothetical protein
MSILDSAKEIADVIKKMGDIELYRKIVELEGQLIDLTREKRELEDRCHKLENELAFSKTLTFKPPVYYAEGDSTPYCATCWENEAKAIHLEGPFCDDGDVSYSCRVCKNMVYTQHAPRRNYDLPPADYSDSGF